VHLDICLNVSPLSWQMIQFGYLFILRLTFPTLQKSLKHFDFQILPFYKVNHIRSLSEVPGFVFYSCNFSKESLLYVFR